MVKNFKAMDDKNKRGPQDASRVNVTEDYELQYWKERFGVSSDELKNAVRAIGTNVTDVEKYLEVNRR
jgi:hypothetical protein